MTTASALPSSSGQKVYIKTFGCQMNEYDSLRMLRLLEKYGYAQAHNYAEADIIILNTCTVRKKAEDKAYSELGRIHQMQQRYRPDLIIAIGGCLAQQEGAEILRKYPFIDVVFGTQAMHSLPELLLRAHTRKSIDVHMTAGSTSYPREYYRVEPQQVSAFVSIMQGCNNFCSYCIVPHVRGREWSRPADDICREVAHLVADGVREITLLGQNVNSYGTTLSPPVSFAHLLSLLNALPGLDRIRFTTSHPKDLSSDLIECFSRLERVCEHIHLPLQSGSNAILAKMNRTYTRENYLQNIYRLRDAVGGISITSDIIVGFPGETEQDFFDTLTLIETVGFDDLFVFHYTERKSTPAANLPDKLPYDVKIQRLQTVNRIQRDISLARNRALIGSRVNVLFDRISSRDTSTVAGRTPGNKVVNCKTSVDSIGKTLPVVITHAHIHSLSGKCLDESLTCEQVL
jgi:tRNA-2-methylthio-N6-dimethylallyladenosine synthase